MRIVGQGIERRLIGWLITRDFWVMNQLTN
jgi:hypothetical protein